MAQYTIYSDYHIGHPFSLKNNFTFSKNNVFLGDNFDLKNVLRGELNALRQTRQETIAKCLKAKGIYLSGNHSLEPLSNKKLFSVKRGKILFVHGDVVHWGKHGAMLYRTVYKAGKSKFFWNSLKYWKKMFKGDTQKVKDKCFNRAVRLAKENKCKTIVMGHFHVSKLVDVKRDGIRIVIVPRGKTLIKL